MTNRLEQLCRERGLRMSGQRRLILEILDETRDHPSVEEIYGRAVQRDPRLCMATVYRTINILAETGVLNRLELGDGRSRYEEAGGDRHEHLIDVQTGKVLEFREPRIEDLVREAAAQLGYRLVGYRLELFAQLQATGSAEPDRPNPVQPVHLTPVGRSRPLFRRNKSHGHA